MHQDESLDAALLARLLANFEPGIVKPATVRRILAWLEYFAGRLGLLSELARRRGERTLQVQESPIVHASPIEGASETLVRVDHETLRELSVVLPSPAASPPLGSPGERVLPSPSIAHTSTVIREVVAASGAVSPSSPVVAATPEGGPRSPGERVLPSPSIGHTPPLIREVVAASGAVSPSSPVVVATPEVGSRAVMVAPASGAIRPATNAQGLPVADATPGEADQARRSSPRGASVRPEVDALPTVELPVVRRRAPGHSVVPSSTSADRPAGAQPSRTWTTPTPAVVSPAASSLELVPPRIDPLPAAAGAIGGSRSSVEVAVPLVQATSGRSVVGSRPVVFASSSPSAPPGELPLVRAPAAPAASAAASVPVGASPDPSRPPAPVTSSPATRGGSEATTPAAPRDPGPIALARGRDVDIDNLVDRVQQRLLQRASAERQRRGGY